MTAKRKENKVTQKKAKERLIEEIRYYAQCGFTRQFIVALLADKYTKLGKLVDEIRSQMENEGGKK